MAVIGVDSSGKAGQPPIFMVAVRNDIHRCIHLTPSAHQNFIGGPEWKVRLTAALIYKTIESIVREEDILEIDEDFTGKPKERIIKCLSKIMIKEKGFKLKMYFGRRLTSKYIQKADVLSKLAKKGQIKITESDPNLEKEFQSIE